MFVKLGITGKESSAFYFESIKANFGNWLDSLLAMSGYDCNTVLSYMKICMAPQK
jgi:hypothetical protein